MSQRGKRNSSNNRPENDGHQPPTKRRKGRPPNSSYNKEKDREQEKSLEEAAPTPSTSKMSASATITKGGSKAGQWQMKCIADLKLSSIYNQRSSEAPAELFRYVLLHVLVFMLSGDINRFLGTICSQSVTFVYKLCNLHCARVEHLRAHLSSFVFLY